MKKIVVILAALFLACTFSVPVFAQKAESAAATKKAAKAEIVRGKITSVDAANNEIVVKENKTGVEKTIKVDSKVIASLKANEEVKVMLKTGTNVAEKVKKVLPKKASAKSGKATKLPEEGHPAADAPAAGSIGN